MNHDETLPAGYGHSGPLFIEPREPVPASTCEHCGLPISRYYIAGLYRSWFHVGSKAVACAHTSASPGEVVP